MGELSIRINTNGGHATGSSGSVQGYDATRQRLPGLVDVTDLLPAGTKGPIYATEETQRALTELLSDQRVSGLSLEDDPAAISATASQFLSGKMSLSDSVSAAGKAIVSSPDRNPVELARPK